MSIARLDDGTTEIHGETRRQHLHLQLRSGQLHHGKRVGTHGNLQHLRNGGDFGFLERIPENRRGDADSTPTNTARTAQYSLFTSAERTMNALGSRPPRLKNCIVIFVRLKRVESSGVLHVSSLVVVSPAFHHEHLIFLTHSSFYTTQEHAAQSAQQERLQEHPVHHHPGSPSRQAAPSRTTLA